MIEITMVGLQRVSKEEGPSFRSFVRANQTALWKIVYFVIAAILFVAAAQMHFSLPQDPLEDGDLGYLWPALIKLSGGTFAHIQGLNFLYPGMVYLILRICADFRAISVIQYFLGLAAGDLFLASWSRHRGTDSYGALPQTERSRTLACHCGCVRAHVTACSRSAQAAADALQVGCRFCSTLIEH
jgi:hypothetical protein